ncbi:hypothetical protein PIB30_005125 [Stylosanthes scabra]|uniref:FLZ-type domain-containing protein n=1 Tax=Stylosanthes scabra TaxID=79078 RepID=A0ABU6Q3U3_9FABA|nr:hypothetical protein [Stylosanthes scabra]
MVGLSVVLEAHKGSSSSSTPKKQIPQVINKTTMMLTSTNASSSSSQNFVVFQGYTGPTFLEQCFLCRKRLLPGNDIYMYKGDRAFCSVDCRCKQIFIDEEEALTKSNSSSSSSTSPHNNHHRPTTTKQPPRHGAAGAFAY